MNRMYSYGNQTFDLGNIKHIEFLAHPDDSMMRIVRVYFLRGKEYVYNPEKEKQELLEPYTDQFFMKVEWAHSFVDDLTKEWEKYLNSRGE